MSKPRDDRQKDLFRPPLEELIDLSHPLARLAQKIDWDFIDGAFQLGVPRRPGATAVGDTADGGASDPQAHARPFGRGAVCTLAGEPLLPVLLRRGEFPTQAALRSLLADALAPAARRDAAFGADPGEPFGGAQDRRACHQGPGARRSGHHGAAQGCRLPDRCPAAAQGDRDARPRSQEARRAAAPVLCSGRQAGRAHGRPLRPCQAVQSTATRN